MTPAALAAIEARVAGLYAINGSWGDSTRRLITADLAALLAHIRTMEAEREAEIAAAVAREREAALEEAAETADEFMANADERAPFAEAKWRDWYAASSAVARDIATAVRALKTAIREPKP